MNLGCFRYWLCCCCLFVFFWGGGCYFAWKGRTANAIKNRWHSVLHKLELQCKNPTKEKEYISEMSRLGFLRPTTQSLRTNWVNFAHQNESESSRNSSCPPREPKEIKNALLPASCSEENYKCSCEDISPPYVSMEPNVLQSLPPCAMILMDDDLYVYGCGGLV